MAIEPKNVGKGPLAGVHVPVTGVFQIQPVEPAAACQVRDLHHG